MISSHNMLQRETKNGLKNFYTFVEFKNRRISALFCAKINYRIQLGYRKLKFFRGRFSPIITSVYSTTRDFDYTHRNCLQLQGLKNKTATCTNYARPEFLD